MSNAKTILVCVAIVLMIIGIWRWFLPGPPMVLNPVGPLVSSGTAMVMVCGAEGDGFMQATNVPDARIGTWSREKRGECDIWYHHPPGAD
jgi:hypothetical protein